MISLCIMGNLAYLALEWHCFGAYVIYTSIFEQDLILVQQLLGQMNSLLVQRLCSIWPREGRRQCLLWFIQLWSFVLNLPSDISMIDFWGHHRFCYIYLFRLATEFQESSNAYINLLNHPLAPGWKLYGPLHYGWGIFPDSMLIKLNSQLYQFPIILSVVLA